MQSFNYTYTTTTIEVSMKKKERIPLKNGYEFDALTKARKWYKYLNKPGVVKKIKKSYNKRIRKHFKVFDKNDVKYSDGDNT
jgi:hypothetical protein